MANKKPNWLAWALRFVGSLLFLAVVWQLWQGVPAWSASVNVFAPVLFGFGVVASVSLFLMALGNLMMAPSDKAMEWAGKFAMWGGVSLLGLLAIVGGTAWGTWSWVALVGFILAALGAWMDK